MKLIMHIPFISMTQGMHRKNSLDREKSYSRIPPYGIAGFFVGGNGHEGCQPCFLEKPGAVKAVPPPYWPHLCRFWVISVGVCPLYEARYPKAPVRWQTDKAPYYVY